MSYELIAILIFSSMMLMLLTGQRVFGAIGGVATLFALLLWGKGGSEMPFNAAFALLNWYPLLTLPLFIYMGYMFSESGIASDLYRMFHVWMGSVSGGLALGTMGLMVAVSAMNGLSVAGMAIGASIAMPEMLKRNYDKVMWPVWRLAPVSPCRKCLNEIMTRSWLRVLSRRAVPWGLWFRPVSCWSYTA